MQICRGFPSISAIGQNRPLKRPLCPKSCQHNGNTTRPPDFSSAVPPSLPPAPRSPRRPGHAPATATNAILGPAAAAQEARTLHGPEWAPSAPASAAAASEPSPPRLQAADHPATRRMAVADAACPAARAAPPRRAQPRTYPARRMRASKERPPNPARIHPSPQFPPPKPPTFPSSPRASDPHPMRIFVGGRKPREGRGGLHSR